MSDNKPYHRVETSSVLDLQDKLNRFRSEFYRIRQVYQRVALMDFVIFAELDEPRLEVALTERRDFLFVKSGVEAGNSGRKISQDGGIPPSIVARVIRKLKSEGLMDLNRRVK